MPAARGSHRCAPRYAPGTVEEIIGTWELVEWTFSVAGRRSVHPWKGRAVGRLTYTADGMMWAALMDPDREHVPTRTLSAAPAPIRAAVAAGYLTYTGHYTVQGDEVVHHVELSLLPNWVGTDEVRRIAWIANEDGTRDLVLSTVPTPTDGGRESVNRLRWRRLTWGAPRR